MKSFSLVLTLILVVALNGAAMASGEIYSHEVEFRVEAVPVVIVDLPESVDMRLEGDVGTQKVEAEGMIITNIPISVAVASSGFSDDESELLGRFLSYKFLVNGGPTSGGWSRGFIPGVEAGSGTLKQGLNTVVLSLSYARPWTGEKWYEITGNIVYTDTITITISPI